MARLLAEHKVLIVIRKACFVSDAEIRRELREEHGIELSATQLTVYDPATRDGKRMSAKLKGIFDDARKRFIEDVSDIPIAHKGYRLRMLDRLLLKPPASTRQAHVLMAILEQAAREVGGQFTNRQEITGAGGGAIQVEIGEAERRERILEILRGAEKRRTGKAKAGPDEPSGRAAVPDGEGEGGS